MKLLSSLAWAVGLSVCFVLVSGSASAFVDPCDQGFGSPAPDTTQCRPAVSDCDVAEYCTGTSTVCPVDEVVIDGSVCRSENGDCDVAEYCDGLSNQCPTDTFNSGNLCRDTAGVCDAAEYCDGQGADCPTDGFASGNECRGSAGVCDVAESCDGQSADCPADGFDSVSECRTSAGVCDVAEYCEGTGVACPANGFDSTTECRPSQDLCDAAETCDGLSAQCPADVLVAADVQCRAAGGVCDQAEVCTGTSMVCPADEINDIVVCRPSAGACDVAESCQKYDNNCPADKFLAEHTECRGTGGNECDVAEACTGTSGECPADAFATAGTLCGDAPDFACEAQDVCAGTAGTCIPNPDPVAACGVIGKGDGCELNVCDGQGPSDFKLLFTPDLPNWVAYKLNASNPGQLFYTLVSEPDVADDANLLIQVPFPFVTQGNMPLHVFGAGDVAVQDSCLVIDEGAGSKPYDVEITMDSYWDAGPVCTEPTSFPSEPGAYCKHVTGPGTYDVVCPSEYDPNGGSLPPALALQECWAYLPVELDNDGRFAARLHLDYGLKGKFLDTYCPADGNVDRYAPGGKGAYGDFDANGIDVTYSSTSNQWLSECNIPTCQPYTFAQGVETEEASDCYSAHGGVGCDDPVCEDIVCTEDDYCCQDSWDSSCADIAADLCSGDPVTKIDSVESEMESVNYFKKPVGIFGRAFCGNGDDDPTPPLLGDGFAGLKVKMYKYGSSTVLAQATTDEDGYYFLNYKHKGKAVYYVVKVFQTDGTTLLVSTSGNNPTPPGNVPLQANGFAEQNFHDGNTCDATSSSGWVPDNWEITKGKFKTIVP